MPWHVALCGSILRPQEVDVEPLHEHHWRSELGATARATECSVRFLGADLLVLCQFHLFCGFLAGSCKGDDVFLLWLLVGLLMFVVWIVSFR